jgi:hypothetical protein
MSRKPDFWVKALDKDTNEKAKIGAAWQNNDGSVSIDLNPFVVLAARKSLVITLFPISRGVNVTEDD